MTKRSLHHYPHDALGLRLGRVALILMAVCVFATACMGILKDHNQSVEWLGAITILCLISTNILSIFSQVLTGGRSWCGAVALAVVWLCALTLMVISGGW